MNPERRFITIVIHRDGAVESRRIRVPLWTERAAIITGIVIFVLAVVGLITYAPIVRTAARVPSLERRMARLTAENSQVHQLAQQLSQVEQRYDQVRTMLGGNIVPPRPAREPALSMAYPLLARTPDEPQHYEKGPSLPTHWPLDERGVITRGQIGSGDEPHPGLDIAVPMGTPIRAAGGGQVAEAGEDPEYGRFILITHPDGYQSMYGHASRLLVVPGQRVAAGEVIGLSGSTGRSTAPHLHFEIRRAGKSIDPRSLLSQES